MGSVQFDQLFRPGARAVPSWVTRVVAATAIVVLAATGALAQTRTVTATWDANNDGVTQGYVVYYGTSSGSYPWSYDAGNLTQAALTLNSGGLYYFVVRAYNSTRDQSPPSNEATIDLRTTTAAPTAQISASLQNATTALVTWSTSGATSVTINEVPVGANGSTTIAVAATTTFTLVATGAGGTTTRSATVTVNSTNPPTASITATLQNSTTAFVTWNTTNAVRVEINGVGFGQSGTTSIAISGTTTFRVVATAANGTTAEASATVTVPGTPPAPGAPPTADINGTVQDGSTAVLTWTTTNAVKAEINGYEVALTGNYSTSLTGTTSFKLVATSASGLTVSDTVTLTATGPIAPNPPTNANASVAGSLVTLSWKAATTGAAPAKYLLYVGTRTGKTDVVNGLDAGNVLAYSGSLQKGKYFARVKAANGAGLSSPSNEASFYVGRRLASPSGFTANWTGNVATLSWASAPAVAADDAATTYVLEIGSSPDEADLATVAVGNVTRVSAPIPPGTFYVRVKAVNAVGESDPTSEVVLAPPGTPALPGAPLGLQATGSAQALLLRWRAPHSGGGPTAYVIEAGSAPGLSDIAVLHVGNVTAFQTAIPRGTYYVRVKALNGGGAGQASQEIVVRR